MLFTQLVEGVLEEAGVRAALDELVVRKQAGGELAAHRRSKRSTSRTNPPATWKS